MSKESEDLQDRLFENFDKNQETVLEWLKSEFRRTGKNSVIALLYLVHNENRKTTPENEEMWKSYRELTTKQEAQLLQVFSTWALKQEVQNV